ncbi:MAG: dihydroorotate dehydrogenase electron transfer subunit [Lachnospiraceae bacterium]|nr:dihydroorotate dehydrogenase electron transfer subunit [Lachnospiraceae bacterium]
MAGKKKEWAKVVSQKQLAEGIYDLWLETDLASQAGPGQFVGLYPRDKSILLPRPISICEADRQLNRLRLVYRLAGQGTKEFSTYKPGEETALLGILGNGFPLEAGIGKKVFLIGGGIGIPPMLQLAKELQAKKQILLGYRNDQLFLRDELAAQGEVFVATEDGSAGTRGNVMDIISEEGLGAEIIYACGPLPMLKAIKVYAAEKGIPAYLSLEERMACGVGACLGCVCKTRETDHHSHVNNARICTDGPVFLAEDLEL